MPNTNIRQIYAVKLSADELAEIAKGAIVEKPLWTDEGEDEMVVRIARTGVSVFTSKPPRRHG